MGTWNNKLLVCINFMVVSQSAFRFVKFDVWLAINELSLLGPFYFSDNLNSRQLIKHILTTVVEHEFDHEKTHAFSTVKFISLQHNNVGCLESVLGNRTIRGLRNFRQSELV